MVETSEIRGLPAFADLPDEQIGWFISQSQEMNLKPDEIYIHQGDPADGMFVVLDGQLQIRGELSGGLFTFTIMPGEITGALPFSRMKQFPVTGRALVASRILRFPASLFPDLVQKMPELAGRLVGMMSDRIRETTRIEQQRDRLAALGKLSAGLAHELNNPASAAKRAASQLRAMLEQVKQASHAFGAVDLTSAQKAEITKLETSLLQKNDPPPDTLTISTLEDQLDTLFRSHGQNDLWELAASLARKGARPDLLEHLFDIFDADTARAALVRISTTIEIAGLLKEIESSTSRISEL